MNDLQTCGNGLKTAKRDIRASARGVRFAHRTHQGRSSEFVQAILDRYKGWEEHWPSLVLAFWSFVRGVTVGPLYQHAQMLLAPRLALSFLGWPQSWIEPTERMGAVSDSMQAESLTLDRLEHPLVKRHGRVELVAHPIPMAVRRSGPIAVSPEGTPREGSNVTRSASHIFQSAVPTQRGPDFGSVELDRLTDQIIQTIDRRIVAHRERMGRI